MCKCTFCMQANQPTLWGSDEDLDNVLVGQKVLPFEEVLKTEKQASSEETPLDATSFAYWFTIGKM